MAALTNLYGMPAIEKGREAMVKFLSREKLSKKARKELDSQRRTLWQYSPVTRKIESKKRYNRKQKSHDRCDDCGMGFLLIRFCCLLPEAYPPIVPTCEDVFMKFARLDKDSA